jgi:hypothetical protein
VKADTFTLSQVFGLTTRYVVPLYQRPYVWTLEQQWEPLWQDIVAVAERLTDETPENDEVPHFMGAIVLAQTWSSIDKTSRLIIDGQQRLTTLQLLMAAVRDVAEALAEQNTMKKMGTLLLIEDYLAEDPEERYKLVPTNADRAAFRHAIGGDRGAMPRTMEGEVSDRTLAAYRYFVSVVRDWVNDLGDSEVPAVKIKALATAIWQLIKIVVIDLEPRDNAQAIFETLNARGQPLLAADLVKNYVFQRAEAARTDVTRLYELYWKPFDYKPWRTEIGQGRARRPRIDVFLTYWLTMKSEGEVSWQELFDNFRQWADTTRPKPESLLADLTENSAIFDGFDRYPVGSREQLFFYRLGVMEANTVFPVILWLFGPQGIKDEADRRNALVHIESWLVRRMLRRLTTKNYNQVFLSLLKHLTAQADPSSEAVREFLASRGGDSQVWPGDADLLQSLVSLPYYKTIPQARLRMVLEAIESDMRGTLVGPFTAWGALSIEHVLPQEWRSNWSLPPGVDELAASIERDTAKHRLGNLSLVTHPLNSSLSNSPWMAPPGSASKREAMREFNVLMLNKGLVDLDQWDERPIEERGRELAEHVLRIWPGPRSNGVQPAVRESSWLHPYQAAEPQSLDVPPEPSTYAWTPERKAMMAETMRRKWAEEDYRQRTTDGMRQRPIPPPTADDHPAPASDSHSLGSVAPIDGIPKQVMELIDTLTSPRSRDLTLQFAEAALREPGVYFGAQNSKGDPWYFQVRHPNVSQIVAYANPRKQDLLVDYRLPGSHKKYDWATGRKHTYGISLRIRDERQIPVAIQLLRDALVRRGEV